MDSGWMDTGRLDGHKLDGYRLDTGLVYIISRDGTVQSVSRMGLEMPYNWSLGWDTRSHTIGHSDRIRDRGHIPALSWACLSYIPGQRHTAADIATSWWPRPSRPPPSRPGTCNSTRTS